MCQNPDGSDGMSYAGVLNWLLLGNFPPPWCLHKGLYYPHQKITSSDSGGKKRSYCWVHLSAIMPPWTRTLLVPEKQTRTMGCYSFTPCAQPKSILKFNVVMFPVCSRCHIHVHPTRCHSSPSSHARCRRPSSSPSCSQYLAVPRYRMFPLFAATLRLPRVTNSFWTPKGGSLERGTREPSLD